MGKQVDTSNGESSVPDIGTSYLNRNVVLLKANQYPKCVCGHLRTKHEDDLVIMGRGRCAASKKCECKQFVAAVPLPPKR